MQNRIQYFPPTDLAHDFLAKDTLSMCQDGTLPSPPSDINDAMELTQIESYLHDVQKRVPSPLSNDETAVFFKQCAYARNYFKTLKFETLSDELKQLELGYRQPFINKVVQHGERRFYSDPRFLEGCLCSGFPLRDLLGNSEFVKIHGNRLATMIEKSPSGASLIIESCEQANSTVRLPRQMTLSLQREIIETHATDPNADPSLIQRISRQRPKTNSPFSLRAVTEAKRRDNAFWENHFAHNEGLKFSCEIVFTDETDRLIQCELTGAELKITVNKSFFESQTKPEEILDLFVYLYPLTNPNGQAISATKSDLLNIFERIQFRETDYPRGSAQSFEDSTMNLFINAVQSMLRFHNTSIEDAVVWFCEEYLPERFKIGGFNLQFLDSGASWHEKASGVFRNLERLANQYTVFVSIGELSPEALMLNADMLDYTAIPSLLPQKYLVPNQSSQIAGIANLLFSPNSELLQWSDLNLNVPINAILMMTTQEIQYLSPESRAYKIIELLESYGLIKRVHGKYQRTNTALWEVLELLFDNECIQITSVRTPRVRRALHLLIERGELEWLPPTLLSPREGLDFNYFLSNKYSNALGLRNLYMHGKQLPPENTQAHVDAYLTGLRLLLILIIKINDELAFWKEEQALSAAD